MTGYKPNDLYGCTIKVNQADHPCAGMTLMCRGFSLCGDDIVAVDYDEYESEQDITRFWVLEPVQEIDIEILDDADRMRAEASANAAFHLLSEAIMTAPIQEDNDEINRWPS